MVWCSIGAYYQSTVNSDRCHLERGTFYPQGDSGWVRRGGRHEWSSKSYNLGVE